MEFEGLDEAWQVWSLESTKAVLAYRPDIFDSQAFPAECLPTIYVTKGRRGRRPGRDVPDPGDPWYVTLYLEPAVDIDEREFDSEEAAAAGAMALAGEFSRGEISYRDHYQVSRPSYFERLDELTGRSP